MVFIKKKKPSQYIPLCFVLNCLFFPHVISLFFVFVFNPIWNTLGTFNFYFLILKGKSKSLGFNSAKPSWSIYWKSQFLKIHKPYEDIPPPLRPRVEPFYCKSHFHVIGISLANYVDTVFLFFHAFHWFSGWVYRCYSSYNMNYMST